MIQLKDIDRLGLIDPRSGEVNILAALTLRRLMKEREEIGVYSVINLEAIRQALSADGIGFFIGDDGTLVFECYPSYIVQLKERLKEARQRVPRFEEIVF